MDLKIKLDCEIDALKATTMRFVLDHADELKQKANEIMEKKWNEIDIDALIETQVERELQIKIQELAREEASKQFQLLYEKHLKEINDIIDS